MSKSNRTYIGDSVYASTDGHHLILETDNGMGIDQRIYLDDNSLNAMFKYIETMYNVKIEIIKNEKQKTNQT